MKPLLLFTISLLPYFANAQTCACEKEFLNIKNVIEKNYAGFPDRIKSLSNASYKTKTDQLLKLSRNRFSSDNCILIISEYLDLFKSHHIGFYPNFDAQKIDTDFVNHRPIYTLKDEKLNALKQSTGWEGIYYFVHDSSYKIAVIRDPSPLHDYIGVIVDSKLPTWKKGMIKMEGKLMDDSTLKGLLYMRNHRPKIEWFGLHDNHTMISGDWRREGTIKNIKTPTPFENNNVQIIDAKSLSQKTFYIKIGTFDIDYKSTIDSILNENESLLKSTPNLILDLRNNDGGSDNSWGSLIPYFYTNPIKYIGVDLLASESNIAGWKKYLEDKNLSKETRCEIENKIAKMEAQKGKWVNMGDDQIDSSMRPKPFPQKIVVLINRWCGSSTEELLLAATQSSKVILVGENTIGNLDYSNVVETPFSCFPYTLRYATTRSRRLNIHQGIDNRGIAPQYHLTEKTDWIKEALKILED